MQAMLARDDVRTGVFIRLNTGRPFASKITRSARSRLWTG